MGKHARNKNMMDFPRRNIKSSEKAVISRKLARTDTSTKNLSQIRPSNKSYILLTTFGPEARTQNESKEVEHQGEFINFKVIFQHNYYVSNNTNKQ